MVMYGMDSGGTARAPLVDAQRRLTVGLGSVSSGTASPQVQGAGAAGAGTVGYPSLSAGVDPGGTARTFSTDTVGRQYLVPSTWYVSGTTAANTAGTLTKTGESSKSHYLTGFEVAIFGTAAGNDVAITVLNGTVGTAWQTYIGSAALVGERVGAIFGAALQMTAGEALKLTVGAAGSVCQTVSNIAGYTR